MRRLSMSGLLLIVLTGWSLAMVGCGDDGVTAPVDDPVPPGENVVLRWDEATLQAVRDTRPGPPMTARALAVVHTCIYDAWAAYDDVAVGTRFGPDVRQPEGERTPGHQSKAMSYAAYRAIADLFPSEKPDLDALMIELGYDPADDSLDPETPAGIGNRCAAAVLALRHADGSNQLGDLMPGAYADYTGYVAMNPPIAVETPSTLAQIPYPDRWQPLTFVNLAGQTVTPNFIAPQWGNVIPFALTSTSQFRPVPPAVLGTPAFATQCDELVSLSANLTDREKCIAEYWADGPASELPPGHWCLFAQYVSRRDHNTLDQDAKMFFAVANAIFDGGIACWDAKRFYDYARPVTAIRYLYNGQPIHSWGGPGQDNALIDGAAWKPYQPTWFPTPPFPEYPSGHSTFSAAAAEVLKRFTGSDAFGFSHVVPAGSLKAEPGISPHSDMAFTYATFTEAADAAGVSRRLGGIHFRDADLNARAMGRRVGIQVYRRAESYWLGYGAPMRLPIESPQEIMLALR